MMISRTWHKAVLVSLAATAAFATGMRLRGGQVPDDSDQVVAPVVRASRTQVADSPVADAQTVISTSRMVSEVEFNPFGPLKPAAPAALGQPKTSAPKPKPVKQAAAPPPPAPPAPTAPPLPFVAVGSLSGAEVAGGSPVAFLQQQDQTILVVQPGQAVGATYRVESISPQRIEFVYLPLMQRQSLPLAPHP
jgi:hypothetical protein